MDIAVILATALAPVVVIFTLVFMLDKYEREPLKLLILSFIFGVLIAVPVVFAEMGLKAFFGLKDDGSDILATALLAFVVVALTEEGFKFLILRLYAYPKQQFNEPYDGIMYAVAISMGFAAIENVLYVAGGGVIVAVLRALTAVPAHGAFAHMMGYFAGKAKFKPTRGKRAAYLAIGLALAVISHGLYDFFLMYDDAGLAIFALITLVVTLIMAFTAIRAHRRNSPFRKSPTAL
jgi:RsiW-degrading membrane proteinase PrsW (M82 family)